MEGTETNEVLSTEELKKKKEEAKIEKIFGIIFIVLILILGTWFLVNEKIIKPRNFAKCGEQPTDDEKYYCCLKNGSLGNAGMDSCYHIYKLHTNETYGK